MFDYLRYDNHDNEDTTPAPHSVKFRLIEDEYIHQWQQCVNLCCWITEDKMRVAGWYLSACTI